MGTLLNCQIVPDVEATQTAGGSNINNYELYITPDEGFTVSAADFSDNTEITFPESIGTIVLPIILEDTISPHHPVNKVKINVDFEDNWVMPSSDYEVDIDISGSAQILGLKKFTVAIWDKIKYNNPDHVNTTWSQGGGDIYYTGYSINATSIPPPAVAPIVSNITIGNETLRIYYVDVEGLPGSIVSLAKVVAQSESDIDEADGFPFMTLNGTVEPKPDVNFLVNYTNGNNYTNWDYNDVTSPNPNPIEVSSAGTIKHNRFSGDILYKIPEDYINMNSIPGYNGNNVGGQIDENYAIEISIRSASDANYPEIPDEEGGSEEESDDGGIITTGTINPAVPGDGKPTGYINNVITNFDRLPGSNGNNIIPSSGISGKGPYVSILGDPGAEFSIQFKETKVVEAVTGRSLGTGVLDTFGNLVQDMPEGIVKISSKGSYSFFFPEVTALADGSYKEFDMIITAEGSTSMRKSVMNSFIESRFQNGLAIGSILINKFYQYDEVNTQLLATKDSNWTFTHVDYDSPVSVIGGTGSNKTGIALGNINDMYWIPETDKIVNFEIRVTRTGGTFSLKLNEEDLEDSSVVLTTLVERNQDDTVIANLQPFIGEGTSDASGDANDFATLTGNITYSKFGKQDQVYTIDLEKIFSWTADS